MTGVWTDDFTADHFADRYHVFNGAFGTGPGFGSAWIAGGVLQGYLGWTDPGSPVGLAAAYYVELDCEWSDDSPNLITGFAPPGSPDPFGSGGGGLYVSSTVTATQIVNGATHEVIAAVYGAELSTVPTHTLLTLRMSVLSNGRADFSLATAKDNGDGSHYILQPAAPGLAGVVGHPAIGGSGHLPPDVIASLPSCVPFAVNYRSTPRWEYGLLGTTPGAPGEIKPGRTKGGTVRVPSHQAHGFTIPGHG